MLTDLRTGLFAVLAIAVVSAAASTILAYSLNAKGQERQVIAEMTQHISERANRQRSLFEDARLAHRAAERTFLRRLSALENTDVSEQFNSLFPEHGDGTRRSRPDLFNGGQLAAGDDVYGFGAFIPHSDALDARRQRALLAAYQTVRQHGEALHPRIDNFYFFTPLNDLLMFGPDRPDRLEFYRNTAPADFDFQTESLARVVSPESNPLGETACTALRPLIYVTDGSALTTGCHSPIRINGRHVGAFGVTIDMSAYLASAVTDTEANTENMILTAEGDLIAHRDLVGLDRLTPEAVAGAEASARSGDFASRIRADGRQSGAFRSGDGRIVGFARIDMPGWYFVSVQPDWLAHSRTANLALLVCVCTFLGVLMQGLIILGLVRWRPHAGVFAGRLYQA